MATFATRLSSGAPTFVPRTHLAPTFPETTVASVTSVPTNTININNNSSNNNNNTITTTTSCQQDSDCGSSSGLGGMKTQEMASDEGGSSSSEPQPTPYYHRPTTLPGTMPCYPTMPIHPNLPNWLHPTPPGASNDLFVHVQVGETLSIIVGNDIQHITGPATVRMVGESGVSPSALPIHVPPGHMVHQIVDDQGILRHLILSPETPPRYPTVPTPSSGIGTRMSTPHLPHHFHQNPLYTVNRKWSHHSGGGKINHQDHLGQAAATHVHRDDEAEMDIDSEEYERVREMLSRILAPQIVRVTSTEADIAWQEIDTSEAAAPGGPFPQIDASEFTYQIVLFENQGRFVNSYRCESSGTHLRLCQLRPNTDYYVQLKASLDERGLAGEPSQPVFFKTSPGRPESPIIPKITGKGSDWISISWRAPNDNGASIQMYAVHLVQSNDTATSEKVWEGRSCEAKISNLKPSTSYKLQVTASNRIGESGMSPPLVASTRSDSPPVQPAPPNASTVSARAVRLTWPSQPDMQYSVEMNEVQQGPTTVTLARERSAACWATIQDLTPSTEYRFRLQAHSAEGDSPKSDWVYVKTNGKPERASANDRVVVPSKPYIIMKTRRKMEVGWRVSAAKEREFTYHLEGSTYSHPNKFRTLYRGPQMSCIITEDDIQNFRVQTLNRKNVASEFSEMLVLPKVEEEVIQKPPQLSAPNLEGAGIGTISVTWVTTQLSLPSSSSVVYEVRRMDTNNEIIYTGKDTKCVIEGLASRTPVEVQVRAVAISPSGVRQEGEWSTVGAILAPRPPPRAPKDLRVSNDKTSVSWTATESCPDIRYHVYFNEIVEAKPKNEKQVETTECKYTLNMLSYAQNYSCRVVAFHDGGESLPSEEIYFTTPAGVPAQPDSVSIEAESTSILLLRWSPPNCRGDPIQQYRIKVESRGEVVRDSCVLSNSEQCEYRICDLQPDTPYRVEISAQNSVGTGVSAAISGRTRCLPPKPPTLEAECDSGSIRLKWRPQTTHSFLTYRIVRLSENDHQSTIYDGDQCSFKVRGLQENTEYRFQIRSSDRQNGAGPWSEVYAFRTTFAAPPAMKGSLVATNAGAGCYQIEWAPIIHKPNVRRLFYRLQALDCSIDNAKWHTVYEGMMTSYTLKVSDYMSAVQARVVCVRPEGESGEIVGAPSSVVYMTNQVIEKKNNSKQRYEAEEMEEERPASWWHLRADRGITSIAVITFIVISLIVAIFVDTLFNLSTPSPSLVSSAGSTPSVTPPPREL